MKAYLDILDNIMTNGKDLRMNRTGIPDIGLSSGAVFEHDMSTGFPLVTTKKMGLKNIATELEFFLRGITDKKWLQDRKCHIWDEWANPIKVEQKYNLATNNMNMSDAEKEIVRQTVIKRKHKDEKRLVVNMDVKFGNEIITAVFSLADREKFEYQALIGRNILTGRAIVDTSVSHTLN